MRFIPVFLLCAGFLLLQCRSNLAQSGKTYDSLAAAKVGKPFHTFPSPKKTYALVRNSALPDSTPDHRYAVIKLKTNEVVLEGKYNRGGYVRWIDDSMIEVLSIPKHVESVSDTALYKTQIFLEDPGSR